MQARVRFVRSARSPLRRTCASSARNAGESTICPVRAQPSAEIVRVECAKCRRECDLPAARATLCGDRACRVPLRRSCVLSARNAGESAICRLPAQPSAEIVRVKCAKCRRECDLPAARATLCGDRACRVREMQASAICRLPAQPSAEIVRVECAKCRRECDLPATRATLCGDRACRGRRECDLSCPRATLCGDRACRVRETQARVRFGTQL